MRPQIAAANWKMNLTLPQAEALLDALLATSRTTAPHQQVILAMPFPYLPLAISRTAGQSHISIAAQNCHHKPSGAYTGEVSAPMLASLGITHILIGHSERREYFLEDDVLLAAKLDIALEHGLTPVFCCGEPLRVREAGTHDAFVATQLRNSLFHLPPERLAGLLIAYEPIWAIGTGRTATAEQAQEMHAGLRSVIARHAGDTLAATIPILYGGSVKGSNAGELFSKPDVDGGLVGGASLDAVDFGRIVGALKQA
ncbi:MAG: triose-phosphate isomerase [Bacteroidetes bacterium]|nr:triose-phosphate isomerase [Bacteroidota bacterium]